MSEFAQVSVNFSAGPAMLPKDLLLDIQGEFLDWYEGSSILEMSHRSEPVMAMRNELEALMRELLNIPDDYAVLMMQGGARGQFCAVPLNLLHGSKKAAYLLTGIWGELAAKAAEKYADIELLELYNDVEGFDQTFQFKDVAYLHYTDNETINGIEFNHIPKVHGALVVSDMTSSILSKPLDWEQLDCVYASAQKNLGISGCTYVIVRRDLLGKEHPMTPDTLNYKAFEKTDSLLNTAPVFPWYVTYKLLKWVKQKGGVFAMACLAEERSKKLYEFIDQSVLFENTIPKPIRSRLNVPFTIKKSESNFFHEATEQGLYFLKGHRLVGGGRASLYNAMPMEGVDRLIQFMSSFEGTYG